MDETGEKMDDKYREFCRKREDSKAARRKRKKPAPRAKEVEPDYDFYGLEEGVNIGNDALWESLKKKIAV